jgi:CP family cyanate transporter-like MFS transporter
MSGRLRRRLVLMGLLGLALNLRAALAGYPPLLDAVREDLGFSGAAAGFVQTGAVLMMAAGSFAGPAMANRAGSERALVGAVGMIVVGSLARGAPAAVPLISGSLLVGFGIGVAGVLLAGVVKQHFADKAGAVTGGYVVAMTIGATAASAAAVPMAVALGGWSSALAVWAIPAMVAAASWNPIARRSPRPVPSRERASTPWRNRFARLVACHQAAASMLVYGWMTWLAPYVANAGWSARDAGLLLGAWLAAQIPGALIIPALTERTGRWRLWSAVGLASSVLGTLGMLVTPLPPVVGPWPWAVLLGIGAGAGFPLGLTAIAWRTPDPAASAAVSGMALGVGYTVAGIGPFAMGAILDLTGAFPIAIAVLLAAAALQAFAIIRIGDTRVGEQPVGGVAVLQPGR